MNMVGIDLKTTSDLSGVAQTKSALDNLSGQSLPQLQGRLKQLNAEAKGLTSALGEMGSKGFSPAALQQFQAELQATNAAIVATKEQLSNMAPAGALGGTLTDLREMRMLMRNLFAPVMAISLIEILARVPEEIHKWTDALAGFDEQAKDTLKNIEALNKNLTAPRDVIQAATSETAYRKKIEELTAQKYALETAFQASHIPSNYQQELDRINPELDRLVVKLKEAEEETNKLFGKEGMPSARPWPYAQRSTPTLFDEMSDIERKDAQKNAQEAARIAKELAAQEAQLGRTATSGPGSLASLIPGMDIHGLEDIQKQQAMLEEMRRQGLLSLQKYSDEEQKLELRNAARHQELTDRVSELDQEALSMRGDKTAAALARVTYEEQRHFDQLEKMYGGDQRNFELLQQAKIDLEAVAAQKRQEIINQEADRWQSWFDRNIRSAKSFSEAMKNVWNEIGNYFEKLVFRQILGGIYGQPSAAGGPGAATAGAGGGLAGILAGIFGAGMGGAGGIAGPNSGMIIKNALPGGGYTLGAAGGTYGAAGPLGTAAGGAGAVTAQQAGAGNLATALGLPPTTAIGTVIQNLQHASTQDKLLMAAGFGGLAMGNDNSTGGSIMRALGAGSLGYGFGHGLGMSAQGSLLTALGFAGVSAGRSIGGIGGFFVGAGSGALAGFEIGNMVVPGIGGLVGAAAGAIIGGLVSVLGGGQNKQKDHDSALENQTFTQMNQILDDYYHFRRDYPSAVDSENQLWNNMVGQFQRPDSAITQRPYFDEILRSMQMTEDERNRRRQLQSLLAVPEFAEGGYVGSGPILARLHPGEFVMTRQAVDRIGTSVLEGLNVAGSRMAATGDGFIASVWMPSKEFAANVVAAGVPIVIQRGGPASRLLRR
jgi:hypothetical protein